MRDKGQTASLKVKTQVKAGGRNLHHNETLDTVLPGIYAVVLNML